MDIATPNLSGTDGIVFDDRFPQTAAVDFYKKFFTPGRYTPLFFLGLFYLLVSLALRLTLYIAFGLPSSVPLWQLPPILGLGMVNDLTELLYLLAPFTLYLLLVPRRFYRSLPGRILMGGILWLVFFGILYLAAVQFFFFQEFNARFNLVAVDYLIYPHEVFINIWQSYPVGEIMLCMAVLSSLVLLVLWPRLHISMGRQSWALQRLKGSGLHLVLLGIAIIGLTTHTLDFSDNRVANELAANGLSSLFQAFRTNHLDYNQYYVTGDRQQMAKRLATQLGAAGSTSSQLAGNGLNRAFPGSAQGLGKLNVVVIVEESLGCEHVGACGQGLDIQAALKENTAGLTTHLDELAQQGVFFNRAYATGTRTVRGLEAISASFPPIPSESIVKRPGNDHIATWGKVMGDNGYQTSFLYGGFGQFDSMNSYFAGNGFAISDRLDIEDPVFANIWGVSDQDLFRHAREYFDELSSADQPFFSIIMTTSNHSPYTFPAGVPGVPEKGGGRNAGVRYADYALGEFFEQAANHAWYDNTLFVVVADHGARVYGKEQIPMNTYEIPLLVMAPGHIQPRQIMTPISQMDIAPTILGLLGLPYEAPFFGRNVLAANDTPGVLLLNHNHDVALYRDDKLVVLGLQNAVNTYSYQLGSNEFNLAANDPELTELAVAYYQTGFDLFTEHAYR